MPTEKISTADMLSLRAVAGLGLQLGFAVAAVAAVCIYGGHKLDELFGTTPYLFWVGVILGLVASIGVVWVVTHDVRARAAAPDPKK